MSIDTFERQAAAEIARIGTCGACGKRPAAPGFNMCIECRDACGLATDEETRRAAEAVIERDKESERRAHERFAAKKGAEKMARPKTWTDEDLRTLRENAHLGRARLAVLLKKSESAVKGKAHQLGISLGDRSAVMHCEYCGREVGDGQGKAAHERACKRNPANAPAAEESAQVSTSVDPVQIDGTIEDETFTLTDSRTGEVVDVGTIEDVDFNVDEPIEERACCEPECAECTCDENPAKPTPKIASVSVEVEVKGLPAIRLLIRDYELTLDVLIDRIRELEQRPRSPFDFRTPRVSSAEDIREWAEDAVEQHKRRRFRERMMAAVTDMESALFDVEEGEDDAA